MACMTLLYSDVKWENSWRADFGILRVMQHTLPRNKMALKRLKSQLYCDCLWQICGGLTRENFPESRSFLFCSFRFSWNSSWSEGNTVFAQPDPPILVRTQQFSMKFLWRADSRGFSRPYSAHRREAQWPWKFWKVRCIVGLNGLLGGRLTLENFQGHFEDSQHSVL